MYKIGIDVEDIGRFALPLQKKSFLNRVYTKQEQEYIFSKRRYAEVGAGIYCAKEAAAKALGTGFFGVHPRNIEISHNANGEPVLNLIGAAKEKYPTEMFEVSISHSKDTATAVVLLIK